MTDRDTRVIGYFAYRSAAEVFCTGEAGSAACLIAGSERAMSAYLCERAGTAAHYTIRKTRFAEIVGGLKTGAAYGFDEEAYGRFYPLAREAGLAVAEEDFAKAAARGDRFLTIQLCGPWGTIDNWLGT